MTDTRRQALIAGTWTALITAILLWPLHRGGYPVGRDLVFTPHQPFNDASVGLGTGAARAVPLDALVALASHWVDGQIIGRLALALPLLAAGWGARRLLAPRSLAAGLSVAGFAVWNPFVVERLALGQWALLWAYGALPWLVLGLRAIRDRPSPRLLAGAFLALAACAITPTGALIGGATVVALGWRSGREHRLTAGFALAAALLVQLPWLLPALLSSASATSDPAGVRTFAARSERPGGVLASLVGLGGIWDRGATPDSRAGWLGVLTTVAVVVVIVLGARDASTRLGSATARRFGVLCAAGLLIAIAAALPGGSAVLRWSTVHLPGAGLLRDGQKWLLPFVLLAVLCLGAAVDRLASRGQAALVIALAIGAALPMLLLPDAGATLRPTLTPARYPLGWQLASQAVHGPGQVLVLPFASYRSFDWVTASSVIDPAPRWLGPVAVVNDQLVVSGRVLAGEDRHAAALGAALATSHDLPTALAAEGIGWVWVEKHTAGPPLPDLAGLKRTLSTADIDLYQVPGPVRVVQVSPLSRAIVYTVDVMLLLFVAISVCVVGSYGLHRGYTRR
jgi:hypothetical protein